MLTLPGVGDQFGRYRIDDEIGRGGMGVVLGATDTTLGRRVALKVIASFLGTAEEFRLRFEREAAVLARLDSPHVIAIYDYGTQDDCPYIATQYVGGGDLGGLLHEQGTLTVADAARLCAQVADALADAHRVGVVHRDVKPTNVLLRERVDGDDDLHVYLCDFGIARTGSDGLTTPGSVAGTWSYLAPECGRGAPATAASDVYAVGCLLWATLTGLPPYRGTEVQIALAHQQSEVRQLPDGTPALRAVNAVLRRAMAKDPANRFADAEQLRAALVDVVEREGAGERAPAVPPGDPGTLAPAPAEHTRPSAVAAGTVPPPPPPPPVSSTAGTAPSDPAPPTVVTSASGRGPGSGGRGRLLLVLGAVLALVVAGVVVAVLATRGDEPRDRRTDPAPSPAPGARDDRVEGDLDGDGLGDLTIDYVPASGGTSATTWLSDGVGAFVDPTTEVLGETAGARGLPFDWRVRGYLDDDDVPELLHFSQPGREGPVRVTGTLSGGGEIDTVLPGGDRPAASYDSLVDVDGDGTDELVTLEIVLDEPPVIVMSSLDLLGDDFADPVEMLRLSDVEDTYVRPGDLDGDGVFDLVTVVLDGGFQDDGMYDATLQVRLGDGEGGFAEPVELRQSFTTDELTLRTADVDGDGADEVVLGDTIPGFLVLRTVDLADGVLEATPDVGTVRYDRVGQVRPDVAFADVDGDGDEDLVSAGVVRSGGGSSGRVLVGVNDDGRFTTSRWLAWDETLERGDDTGRVDVVEDSRWGG